jgi:hypothetical protein
MKTIGLTVVGLVVVCGIVALGSLWVYGPLGPIPGPELSGSVVEEPVEDWSFIDAVKEVQIETRPADPYSVNTWATRVGNHIYVFAGGEESPWVVNIGQDPQVRVRVEGRIHECRAARVTDLETKHAFLEAMKAKYEGDFGFNAEFWQQAWDTGELILFRMDPRQG